MVNWRRRPSRHLLRLRVLRRKHPRLPARIVSLVAAGAAVAGVNPTSSSIGVAELVNHDHRYVNVPNACELRRERSRTHVPMIAMYRLQPSSQHSVSHTVTYCKTY